MFGVFSLTPSWKNRKRRTKRMKGCQADDGRLTALRQSGRQVLQTLWIS
ncbi:MAG: hypothetical protein LBQ75_09210 [Zoogloeaceae bacterium]|jgi:hypothetical protein|nr:hypothetical protein [Zoogloeaceae bacterium]